MKTQLRTLFKKASTTFYNSSMFFPEDVRDDVVVLYAYVRTADDFVDGVDPDCDGIEMFSKYTIEAWNGKKTKSKIVNEFIELAKRKKFKRAWIQSFLQSMKSDLYISKYQTYQELQEYMYGSAEVIGLMMGRILKLPEQSERYARFQGEAFQLINFIRDIGDDMNRGRVYIPQEDLQMFGISDLDSNVDKEQFIKLIQFEIARFFDIQKKAEIGYQYIPKKYLVPIKTARDMFIWTAREIEANPMIVFEKQVKPSANLVKLQFMKNMGGIVG